MANKKIKTQGMWNKITRLSNYQRVAIVAAVIVTVGLTSALWITGDQNKDQGGTAAGCDYTAMLEKPCRPLIGATVGGYPQAAGNLNAQTNFLNKRINNPNVLTNPSLSVAINKKIDVGHVYHPAGSNLFSGAARDLFNNKDIAQVFVNWKPLPSGYRWKDAGGSNTTVNNYIRQAAEAAKALGNRKFYLAIWHEPENDVSSGNCTGNASGAGMGSPAEYVAMWRNVRKIFNEVYGNSKPGNIVWAMNYMGYPKWDCLVPLLWPGNEYIDWIVFDQYASGDETFYNSINRFYTYLTQKSTSTHNYLSKIWGLAEHGYGDAGSKTTEAYAVKYWQDGRSEILKNSLPRVKMWLVFDTSTNGTMRVGYTFDNQIAINEQTAFNGFVDAVLSKETTGGTPTPPPPPAPTGDTTAPNVSFTAPANNATVSKVISVTANATDNKAVTNVKLYVDGATIKDDKDGSDGWTSQWNTWNVSNGQHTLKAVAADAAGNSKTATITITVNNALTGTPTISAFAANPATVVAGNKTMLSWATTNTVSCSVSPGGPANTTATSWQTLALNTVGKITYTLTCKNSSNATTSKTATVTITAPAQPPSNVSLSASATTVARGGNTTLSWSATNATSCTLNPGGFSASGNSSAKTVANLQNTTKYKVTCSNSAGSRDSNEVTITVTDAAQPPAAPSIVSFSANPRAIGTGATSTLTWTASNVVPGGCNLNPSPLTSTSGNGQWTTPILTKSVSYTLTCKNAAGATTSKSLAVIVANQPAPAAPAPVAAAAIPQATTDTTIKATTGENVVNSEVAQSITQGDLVTLDPILVADEEKVSSIVKVEYYDGDKLIQTATEPPFALTTTSLSPGDHDITQRTYFMDGSVAEKRQVITITAPAAVNPTTDWSWSWVVIWSVGGLTALGGGMYVAWRYLKWRSLL